MGKKAEKQASFEKTVKTTSRLVHAGRVFSLRVDTYVLENTPKNWDIVVHPGAVVIVPVTSEGRILLVEQWRRAANQVMIELPAGTLEKGEPTLLCAQRELQEETGFRAGEIIPMGGFYTVPGYCTEYLHLFLAKDLEAAPLPADDGEEIDLLSLSLDEVHLQIESGKICDAKTIAGIYRYERWLKRKT